MTHLQKLVSSLKAKNNTKALALIAAISSPTLSYCAPMPSDLPPDRTITQWAEDTAKVSPFAASNSEGRIAKFEQEARSLAGDAFVFLEKLRTNQRYSQVYAEDAPAATKLELIKKLLDEDCDAFNSATNQRYRDLAQLNDADAAAALKSLPGMTRRLERVSETIAGIREVMVSFRQSTADGPNRADQENILKNDIQLAEWRLAAALAAIEQRYGVASSNVSIPQPENRKPQDRRQGFGI